MMTSRSKPCGWNPDENAAGAANKEKRKARTNTPRSGPPQRPSPLTGSNPSNPTGPRPSSDSLTISMTTYRNNVGDRTTAQPSEAKPTAPKPAHDHTSGYAETPGNQTQTVNRRCARHHRSLHPPKRGDDPHRQSASGANISGSRTLAGDDPTQQRERLSRNQLEPGTATWHPAQLNTNTRG
jgi:hypothetical protein